jgi:hypothetical protein
MKRKSSTIVTIALLTLAVMIGTASTPTPASAETWSVTLNLDWNDLAPRYNVHAMAREFSSSDGLIHSTELVPSMGFTIWTGTIAQVNSQTAYVKVTWTWGEIEEHWMDTDTWEWLPPWTQFPWDPQDPPGPIVTHAQAH